jgi:hypothetical protein
MKVGLARNVVVMHVKGIPKDLSTERADKNKYIESKKDNEKE